MAAAGLGGLTLKESAHFHAEGMTCSAFRHGPFEMVGPDVFVLVFAGDPQTAALNEGLVRDVRQAGGKAALAGTETEGSVFRIPRSAPAVRPIVESSSRANDLAGAGRTGRPPAGQFRLLTKVTTIE